LKAGQGRAGDPTAKEIELEDPYENMGAQLVQITIESDEGKAEVLQEFSLPTSRHLRRGEACAHLPASGSKCGSSL